MAKFNIGDEIYSEKNPFVKYRVVQVDIPKMNKDPEYTLEDIWSRSKGKQYRMPISRVDKWGVLIVKEEAKKNSMSKEFEFAAKESEDEIRKFLIDYFECIKSTLSDDGMWKGFKIEKILAYIEKKKEVDLEEHLQEHLRVFLKEYYNYDYPKQYNEGTGSSAMPHIVESAIHFAEWQKRQSINKACSWLENNLQGIVGGSIYIEDFRKYMEE